jgi:erythrin-vacuolar iron transport family protein
LAARKFKDLSEREILALAIALEEEDGRVYADFADGLREAYPATAKLFEEMREEEWVHRGTLIETFRARFGEHIPLLRRQDIKGFMQRRPFWLTRPLKISEVRRHAEMMELETRQFYQKAIAQVTDAGIRKLLGDLEEAERKHQVAADGLGAREMCSLEKACGLECNYKKQYNGRDGMGNRREKICRH